MSMQGVRRVAVCNSTCMTVLAADADVDVLKGEMVVNI